MSLAGSIPLGSQLKWKSLKPASSSHRRSSRKRSVSANATELPRGHRERANGSVSSTTTLLRTSQYSQRQLQKQLRRTWRCHCTRRAEASEDLGVWALDGPLDDPTALPWPSSLDEDWPGFSGSLVDTLSPRQLSVSVSVPGISNPEPRAPPASSSSLTSDSNDSNSRPSRLLHIAARNGTTGILLSLIKAGADVNSRDSSGTTPLHIAVRFRRASALELLVNHGANINARDSANMTALEVAVRAQDEELVNILLSGGAELH
ncbi:uncharacterized protein Y057_8759 [Fusarium fujikuroi]|nr:uncharacterized protein Y057_8759 [Fusarium fujikuroi]